jgi:hypothetical protein
MVLDWTLIRPIFLASIFKWVAPTALARPGKVLLCLGRPRTSYKIQAIRFHETLLAHCLVRFNTRKARFGRRGGLQTHGKRDRIRRHANRKALCNCVSKAIFT